MHLQLALTRGLHIQLGNGPYRLQLELYRRWLYIRLPFVGEGHFARHNDKSFTGWKNLRSSETAGWLAEGEALYRLRG